MTLAPAARAGVLLAVLVLTATGLRAAPADAPEPAEPPPETPVLTCGWGERTQRAVLDQARELMPAALERQLKKHHRALMAGVRQARGDGSPHLQGPLQEDGSAVRLAESLARASALIDARRPMKEVAREMGIAAHLVADLSNPFLGAPDEVDAAFIEERFEEYITDRRDRFRVVFEGYRHPLLDDRQVEAFGRSLADRSRSYLDDVIGAFRRYDAGEDPTALDDRSVAFGVASLTYSRSVTDTARAWLHAWTTANGDLTGLPYPFEE